MAFLLYKEGRLTSVSDNLLKEYKQSPTFFIPDVTAEPSIFNKLLFNLSKKLPNQPFLVWEDPRITEPGAVKENTIETQGEQIAHEVEKTMRNFPNQKQIRMVGFSFGCTIGTDALQQFKQKNPSYDVSLSNIDSPTAIISSQFLEKPAAIDDFILMAQEAGKLVNLPIAEVEVDEEQKQQWNKLPIDRRIKAAQLNHFAAQPSIDPDMVSKFYKIGNIIKHNLLSLLKYSPSSTVKLDHVQTLFTEKTLKKYQCRLTDGGWSKYAHGVETHQVKGNHSTVLSDAAEEISTFIKSFLTQQLVQPKFKRQVSKTIVCPENKDRATPAHSLASLFSSRTPSPCSISPGTSPLTSDSDSDDTSSLSSQDDDQIANKNKIVTRSMGLRGGFTEFKLTS